jgi:broad-specificity NMP kinase
MPQPAVLVITGASGVGKTTLVRAVDAHALPDVRCYYFDSIGVPPLEEMIATFGSTEGWQAAMTDRWIARLAANPDRARVLILDGQVRPSIVRAALRSNEMNNATILLVDCSHDVREARLRARGQPELATPQMAAWAAYLRGQADALELPILDTSELTPGVAAHALLERVHALATH